MLTETKRFFGFEEPPLPELVKTQGKLAIIDIQRSINPDRNGLEMAILCAERSNQLFRQTDKTVKLTKSPFFALTDEHIEFGSKWVKNEHNQLVRKPAFWRIHGRTISELNFTGELVQGESAKAIENLKNQSSVEVAKKFISTIESAIR
jgi:hypothetical protein